MWKVGETRAHLEGTRVPGSEGLNPLGMDLKDSNLPHCWMGRGGFQVDRGAYLRMEPQGWYRHQFSEGHQFKERAGGFEVFARPSVQSAVTASSPYIACQHATPSSSDLQRMLTVESSWKLRKPTTTGMQLKGGLTSSRDGSQEWTLWLISWIHFWGWPQESDSWPWWWGWWRFLI